jgi:hypothetical protein
VADELLMQVLQSKHKDSFVPNFEAVRMLMATEAGKLGGLSLSKAFEISQESQFGFTFNLGSQEIKIDSFKDFK